MKPSEQGLFFQASQNESKEWYAMIDTYKNIEVLISCWDIYVFVSVDHSIPLVGLILTGFEKQELFWRFCAEMLIVLLRYLCFCKFRL